MDWPGGAAVDMWLGFSAPPSGRDSVGRPQQQLTVLGGVDDDRVSVGEHALEKPNGERLNELLLDHSLQRPRAVRRVEASPRQLLLCGRRQLETHLALVKPFAEAAQLDLDNALDLLQPKCMEDHDFVDPIDQLWPEVGPYGVHDPLSDVVFAQGGLS